MSDAPAIRQITAQELKAMLDEGLPLQLLDVRTEAEREIARIEGARHLDQAAVDDLQGLDRGTLLVFQCHHGIRSQSAARYFAAQGFTNVANLVGGIEAWSVAVDPSVPRY
jgi:monothiol glutaredoxin